MIFCLSVSDIEGRVILDDESHGDTLAVIEASSWVGARRQALTFKAMDSFDYRPGVGWVKVR